MAGSVSLSGNQIAEFRQRGFLVVEDVLSAEEVTAVAERGDQIAAGGAEHVPESSVQLEAVFRDGEQVVENRALAVRKLYNLAVYDSVMWAHVVNKKIVDIVAALLETEDLKMYGDQFFMKAPATGTAQPWHQDSASWRDIFPMALVTAWAAIDDATLEHGCLHFAPGTPRWGMMRREQVAPFVPDLDGGQWPVVAAPLKSGSVSFHHSLILHKSGANDSILRRRGYAVHYMRAASWRDESVTDAPKMPPFKQVRGNSFPGRV